MSKWIAALGLAAGVAFAQGNPDGSAAYRARCASCHGADAKGTAAGSDLTGLWTAGATERQTFDSVRRGVPNTLKPHSFGPDNEVRAILAYLHTLDSATSPPAGNAGNGARIFDAQCSSCHLANGRGGRLGPDLSRVGATRSRALLAHKIRHVKKNEDAYSIQIMDTSERVQGFTKNNLREFHYDDTSLMPDFGPDRLPDGDLSDLLAYLGTLRTMGPASGAGGQGVTYEDLRKGLQDPSRWLLYSGDYTGQRHSPLTQLTPANVS